jgi:hypothetical protein
VAVEAIEKPPAGGLYASTRAMAEMGFSDYFATPAYQADEKIRNTFLPWFLTKHRATPLRHR